MKLLILEDDPVVSAALEAACEPTWPFEVQAVSSCNDAIFQLSGPHYIPLVLVDLNLPDGDGLNVLKVAFERGLLAFTQSAIMTACAHPENVLRARSLGIQRFLVKPVRPEFVQAALFEVLTVEHNMAGDSMGLLRHLQEIELKTLSDSQMNQIYRLSVQMGCHSVGRALARLRQYLSKPYRKFSEIESAWQALLVHCEVLGSDHRSKAQGVNVS